MKIRNVEFVPKVFDDKIFISKVISETECSITCDIGSDINEGIGIIKFNKPTK
jgi:hypothetical protein